MGYRMGLGLGRGRENEGGYIGMGLGDRFGWAVEGRMS